MWWGPGGSQEGGSHQSEQTAADIQQSALAGGLKKGLRQELPTQIRRGNSDSHTLYIYINR